MPQVPRWPTAGRSRWTRRMRRRSRISSGFPTGPTNREWDGIWDARVTRHAEGWSAEVELPYVPGKTYQGRVDYIHPTLAEATQTVLSTLKD